MKIFLFILCLLVCMIIVLFGCRASLRAGYLQSDIALSAFGSTAPPPVEFADDQSRIKPE